MSRYDIAKRKANRQTLRFNPARSVASMTGFMQQCIDQDADMDISNQPASVVEQAAVKIAKGMHIPVLVSKTSRAHLMRIAYGYSDIFASEECPETHTFALIVGRAECPLKIKSVLRVRGQ